MSSSISNSSAEPTVTVVIGSTAPAERLEACLGALESQREAVEVRVHEGVASPRSLRERYPWVTFVHADSHLVPLHWRDGIDAASGEIVALTISQMIPSPDWIASIRAQHRVYDAVGGAIDPGQGLRQVDWAEYFCRYSRDMRPFAASDDVDLAGDNAAYKRSALEQIQEATREGFWEPVAHPALKRIGITLWHTPELVVYQGRSAGFSAFARQRLVHGRLYGRQRGAGFSRARNAVGVLAAPAVPFLMTLRVLTEVKAKKRYQGRAVAALPLIFALNAIWAYAEALGHLDTLRGSS
jgi:hypothetical protein